MNPLPNTKSSPLVPGTSCGIAAPRAVAGLRGCNAEPLSEGDLPAKRCGRGRPSSVRSPTRLDVAPTILTFGLRPRLCSAAGRWRKSCCVGVAAGEPRDCNRRTLSLVVPSLFERFYGGF